MDLFVCFPGELSCTTICHTDRDRPGEKQLHVGPNSKSPFSHRSPLLITLWNSRNANEWEKNTNCEYQEHKEQNPTS